MAGPVTSSKPFDNLVLSNLSSPRFDISDFLKTPSDGSPKEKETEEEDPLLSTFQGFTLPSAPFICASPVAAAAHTPSHVHHHLHNIATPDPIAASAPPASAPDLHGHEHPEGDFGTAPLFEECKGADFNMDHVLNHGELIPFDDYIDGVLDGGDSFSIFNDVNYDTTVSSNAPGNLGYVPYLSADSGMMMLPSLCGPSSGLYAPPEPYLGSEAGSLVEVGDHVLVGLEHRASTSGAPSSLLYPNSQIDWGVSNHGAPFSAHLGQPGSLQCESCQLLRRIIHSNGVQDTKLEIHGRHGQSYHAVLQTRFCIDDGFPSTLEQQMVDFPVGNSEYVKQFLLQYSMLRSKEGFILRHDSLQVPMDLSCIASEQLMSGANMQMLNQSGQNNLTNGNCSTDSADPSALPVKPPKSNAAAQVVVETVVYISIIHSSAQLS